VISGCKLWADRKTFSVQTNNSVEALLRRWSGKNRGFLETCGPTSAVNVLDALGVPTAITSPKFASVQPEDFLTLWMNDPANLPGLKVPDDRPTNEYAYAYPNAIGKVFGASALYLEGQGFDQIAAMVTSGRGAMICLVNPGHFLAVVAYDDQTKELIYRDPWPNRTQTDGFNLRMGRSEFESNVKPYAVVFSA